MPAPSPRAPFPPTRKLKAQLRDLIDHLQVDVHRITSPKARALFESSAEVLTGLLKAFDDYEQHEPAARKLPS